MEVSPVRTGFLRCGAPGSTARRDGEIAAAGGSTRCPWPSHSCRMRKNFHASRRREEASMNWQSKLAVVFVAACAGAAATPAYAQGVGKYFAPQDQVVALKAGRLFDAR